MMEMYQTIPFILEDGSENKKTCPVINTEIFLKHGLEQKDKQQILEGNIMILHPFVCAPLILKQDIEENQKKQFRFIGFMQAGWKEQKKSIIKNIVRHC